MAGIAESVKSVRFRRERRASWDELEALVSRIEKRGLASLSTEQLTRLPVLHRGVLSSLSVARSISLDRNLLDYLESLTARSYFCVYGTRRPLLETIADFFLRRFPARVRRFRWHVALSAFFLAAGVLAGFLLTRADPDRYYAFVTEEMAQGRDPTASTEELAEVLGSGDEDQEGALTAFASFLFTHNSRVGMLCFSLGFAAGLPVFYLLLTNGLVLGAMAALYADRGLAVEFWGWILPHGLTELFAVVLCGAAGLVIAQGLLFPARHGRLANLALQGRAAGQLVLGGVVLLAIAALIEGYFRQLVQAEVVRYSLALVTAAGWILYFTLLPRERTP